MIKTKIYKNLTKIFEIKKIFHYIVSDSFFQNPSYIAQHPDCLCLTVKGFRLTRNPEWEEAATNSLACFHTLERKFPLGSSKNIIRSLSKHHRMGCNLS